MAVAPVNVGDFTITTRRAELPDAHEVAALWLHSRRAAFPSIPAAVHSDDEVHSWLRQSLRARDSWVALDARHSVRGMMILDDRWVDQLYVDPDSWRAGIGSILMTVAKAQSPDGLELWTFQRNAMARRFYENHGFTAAETTDGSTNEERTPDLRMSWGPSTSPTPGDLDR